MVKPVPKKELIDEVNNYHPVTLVHAISTKYTVALIMGNVIKNLNNKIITGVLDLSKAFNCIEHKIILHKLH